ncbi:unnamed protein product, partial [Meganyctiphanes norvegica]
ISTIVRLFLRLILENRYFDLIFTPTLGGLMSNDPILAYIKAIGDLFYWGKFAAVKRIQCKKTGIWFAAKVVRKRRRSQDVRHEILHEAAVLALANQATNHRIVRLHRLFETQTEMILVLELAGGGELQRVLDMEECLEESVVRRYMISILNALRFLHHHNIAHLDLKPQNLLLMDTHPESPVKLCDFGISRLILSDIELREVLGTPDYVAPEVLQYEPIRLATDMWSVGVLAYVLLTGHSPFGGDTKQETFLNISQGKLDFEEDLFENVSGEAMDFISRLIVVNPSGRLTVDKALEHPWLTGSLSSTRISPSAQQQTSKTESSKPESSQNSSSLPQSPDTDTARRKSNNPSENKENDKNKLNIKMEEPSTKKEELSTVTIITNEPKVHIVRTTQMLEKENKGKIGEHVSKKTIILENNMPREPKENLRENLKLSPLCLRRQGSKCELHSPGEQKFGSILILDNIILS